MKINKVFLRKKSYQENFFVELKKISMLHKDTLRMMNRWSSNSKYNVLEIGSYVGGGTIALARGTRNKVIVIEAGGAYDHNMIPSTDIIKDLRENLRKWGVKNVSIIEDFSESSRAVELVKIFLNGGEISLLVLDSNGSISSEIERYKNFFAKKCRIIIDDYLLEGSESEGKNLQVHNQTNRLIDEGVLMPEFVNGWGTLFGVLNVDKIKKR